MIINNNKITEILTAPDKYKNCFLFEFCYILKKNNKEQIKRVDKNRQIFYIFFVSKKIRVFYDYEFV